MAASNGTQVLRLETHRAVEDRLVNHLSGRTRPPTAREVAPVVLADGSILQPIHQLIEPCSSSAAREVVQRHWPSGRGGKPRALVEGLMAGLAAYGEQDEVPPEREAEYHQANADWLQRALPHVHWIQITAHRDETSPHTQFSFVPIDSTGKLSWKSVRTEACALARGEVGSQAMHEQIDRAKAAERRERLAREQAEREERRAAEATALAEEARDQRALAEDAADTARKLRDRRVAELERLDLAADTARGLCGMWQRLEGAARAGAVSARERCDAARAECDAMVQARDAAHAECDEALEARDTARAERD